MALVTWFVQVVSILLVATLVTVAVRRLLERRVGVPRTFLLSLIALVAALPLYRAMGHAGAFFTPGGHLLAPLPAVFALVVLTFLWAVALEILALVILEVIVPTGSVPTPLAALRGIRGWWRRTRRYLQLSWIVSSSGLAGALRAGPRDPGFGVALTKTMNRSGVTFVKLGQLLSTRPDLLPPSTTNALSQLQAHASPLAVDQVRAVLVTHWGAEPEQMLRSFDNTPLAAASVAQVHAGVTTDGRDVVVKVQRPRAPAEVAADSDILLRFAATAEHRFDWARSMSVAGLAKGLTDSLAEELDYRVEASNTAAMRNALAGHPLIATPDIVPSLSGGRVLVMTRLRGHAMDEAVDRLDASTRTRIAAALMEATLDSLFVHGIFHADLHPGNMMLLDDGWIGLLDFGSIGVLDSETRQLLAALVFAVVNDNNIAATTVLSMIIDLPPGTDQRALRRDLGRICTLQSSGGPGSGSLFPRLLSLMGRYRLAVPPDIAGALRSLGTLENTLVALDPDSDLISSARTAMPEILRRLASPSHLAGQMAPEAMSAAAVARRLPGRLEQLSDQLVRGQFVLQTRTLADRHDRSWVQSRVEDALSAVLAVAAVVTAIVLVIAPGGPMVTSDVSLYDLAAAALGFAGLCLVLRLVLRLFGRGIADPAGRPEP